MLKFSRFYCCCCSCFCCAAAAVVFVCFIVVVFVYTKYVIFMFASIKSGLLDDNCPARASLRYSTVIIKPNTN